MKFGLTNMKNKFNNINHISCSIDTCYYLCCCDSSRL